ncbi:hypothetical protein E1301_Tti022801 [Triplophysa tibetana]|uniref:Uncharacterized protein n=1 Tax=Triplophysa tibetana TaxID=1572043 RepID=A0A5A9PHF3_9TELE|nr:hypothetical protein E1301_Tti022801 [Triplophysa tibetana]
MHWGTRTAASSERWREARPSLINNRLATEHIEGQLCLECKEKVAVVKCKDCLPKQYTCIKCDCAIHCTQVFHNRSTMISGFHKAVPPTTVVKQDSDGQYFHHHEDRILPMALPNSICSCGEEKYSVGKARSITVINMKATNKGRNKIRRKMNEERKKLSSSIEQHNALVDPSFKVVSIEEVLQNDFVFPWQLTEQDDVNLLTKKKVFDKVMLIQRLEEEQTVLVQEAKQHWLYLRSQEHKLNSLLDTIISGVNPWNLPDDGIQGLQCVLNRKLHELRAHQDTVKTSYQAIDTITEHITVEECEYPNWLEPSEVLYSSSNDLSSDEDDAFLL